MGLRFRRPGFRILNALPGVILQHDCLPLQDPRIPDGRDYMLEINPHYLNREQTDKMNVIDARWIDTTSGLFIDITTARYNATHPAGEGMLSCKDGHEYRVREVEADAE